MLDTEAFATLVGESPTWQPMDGYSSKDCIFNADHVLHAYSEGMQTGFVQGIQSLEQAALEIQKRNQEQVGKQCRVILDFLRQRELVPIHVYLQTIEWKEMNVIMFIEEDSFLKQEFNAVYDLAFSIENAEAERGLYLSFSFAPFNEALDILSLNADGYTLRLKPRAAAHK